ncbi:hypothetical protein BO85DRAFT_456427 [Aspergillus piperis CBS 112811]|uniref:Uncharacterized protein n=2 Tax=Aspergillus subgen. Circumdati TaxID=2720871 RepID=A0A8G1RA91_9EURO|nr:hypothetical protein BO85DRAFT_456427 [Aspergillus piperis CBS 112811]RAH62488.1 hypothetical protein BO85DRAFT_456427 [Aspergillus piperis CBS 112811]
MIQWLMRSLLQFRFFVSRLCIVHTQPIGSKLTASSDASQEQQKRAGSPGGTRDWAVSFLSPDLSILSPFPLPFRVRDSASAPPLAHAAERHNRTTLGHTMSYTSSSRFSRSPSPAPRTRRPSPLERTSLHLRLSLLSGEKYDQESSAKEPDLRRCLSHAHIHAKSMAMVKRDIRVHIRSMGMAMDDDGDEELLDHEVLPPPPSRRSSRSSSKSAAAPRVTVSPKPSEKSSLLDKGRKCLEKLFPRKNNVHLAQSRVTVVT